MTPAIDQARRAGITFERHEYRHDPKADSYGMEAAEKLGVSPQQVFKTLVAQLDGKELVVAVLPVDSQLNLKSLAKALAGKRAVMADKNAVQRSSGYVLGGVSPLGQKRALRTVIDASAESLPQMYVSAGRRGLEISLRPQDLAMLCDGQFADIKDS
ncbi:Cys-tRNA(Pro) deacylase [Spongiibacter taiwanensis]|uniref:Cys-tRNA(Pro) deacylase n=1 Tax=Spongiibacter taiwanensis TaxID=1748242 RepID=UPI00203514C8|nr:Cys-tRNA(Pro) deacylase [Spongiibacter taiwanensis]USA43724.1 Cys-tRNA(Pro) deacylase [Spongiibacter taiwanensis]